MYKLFQTDNGSRGSLAEVWIDEEANLVKKYYKPSGITITGKKPYHTDIEEIKECYLREVFWTNKYPDFTLKIFDHGALENGEGFYIIQEYGGPDLVHEIFNDKTITIAEIENFSDQVLEMFNQYKEQNMYKLNNALCNMVYDRNTKTVKTFDFKYARERHAQYRHLEIYSVTEWISKIDPALPKKIINILV